MPTLSKNQVILLPAIAFIIYFFAGILYDPEYIKYTKPFIIPSFLLYAFLKNGKKFNLNYYLFVALFYLNEVLLLYWEDSIKLFRTALIASFFCYLTLFKMGYNVIKNKNVYNIPKGYTLFTLLLNCFFMFAVLYILISEISDIYVNIIIVFNVIITIILSITAVLYLGRFGERKTYYYFFGVFALIFNDVFAAIGIYFMDNVFLNSLDRLLHFVAFYLIYLFVTSKSKIKSKQEELSF
jgi:hypothetical protein